jgi:O-antigen/teichoic acid export membrane protein
MTPKTAPASSEKHHTTFFRQSGWLMIASIASGLMSFGVHFLSKKVESGQYSAFGVVLMVITCLPTIAIQMVFAQQAASALVTNRQRQVGSMIRLACVWTLALWIVAAVLVFVFKDHIVLRWQLPDATILWITMATVLIALWMPIFGGALQGKQDFLWLGWSTLLPGILRLAVAAVLVLVFSGGAISMMTGALIGMGFGLAVAIWRTRDWWRLPSETFDYRTLLRHAVPLMLGFWACQFLFTSDIMFARAFFSPEEVDPYLVAGTLARAVQWMVLPLAVVMFPKLVHSAAKSEKTNLLKIVLIGTAILAVCGGLGLWLLGPWLIQVVGKPEWVEPAKQLLPWYAAATIMLALANVLANDLLARGRYKVVPFMVLVAVGYGFTLPYVLKHYPLRLEVILQTLTAFNFLLLVVCSIAAFGKTNSTPAKPPE